MPLELSAWLTPAILIAVAALLLRSHARLEERLGARIDEVNKSLGARIDEVNKSLGARIDETNKSLGARIDEVNKSLGARIDETNKRIDETNRRIDEMNRSLGARIDVIDDRLRAVEHGQARLEGLLDGLREAIAGRRPAA